MWPITSPMSSFKALPDHVFTFDRQHASIPTWTNVHSLIYDFYFYWDLLFEILFHAHSRDNATRYVRIKPTFPGTKIVASWVAFLVSALLSQRVQKYQLSSFKTHNSQKWSIVERVWAINGRYECYWWTNLVASRKITQWSARFDSQRYQRSASVVPRNTSVPRKNRRNTTRNVEIFS